MASGEMIYLSGICDTGIGVNFSGGMSSATLPKDSLMASTLSCSSTWMDSKLQLQLRGHVEEAIC
jgi:hypothetical protein